MRRNGSRGSVSRQQLSLLPCLGFWHQPYRALVLDTSAGPSSPFKQRGQPPNAGMVFHFHWSLHNEVFNPPSWEDLVLRQSFNNTGNPEAFYILSSQSTSQTVLFNRTSKTRKNPHIPFLLWQQARTKGYMLCLRLYSKSSPAEDQSPPLT